MPLHRQSVKRSLLFWAQPKLWDFPAKILQSFNVEETGSLFSDRRFLSLLLL